MKPWKKWTMGLAILVLAGAGGFGYWWSQKRERPLQGTVNLSSVRVTRGDIEVRLSGSGSVNVRNEETVRPSENARVKTVEVKKGDRVEQGQVLVTFEGNDNGTQIGKLELNLEQQRLQLEQAQNQYRELQRSGAEESALEQARINIRSIQLNIEQTLLELEEAKEAREGPEPLVAPIMGTVTAISVKPGDVVTPQTEAVVITDYDHLQLTITVDEMDVPKLKVGQTAEVTLDALPGRIIRGTVEDISMEGTQSNGVATFPVNILLEPAEGVRPGMSGTAEIVTASKQNVLLLPIEAVQTAGGRYFALVPASAADRARGGNDAGGGAGGPDRAAAQGGNAAEDGAANRSGIAGRRGVPAPERPVVREGAGRPGATGRSGDAGAADVDGASDNAGAGGGTRLPGRLANALGNAGATPVSIEIGLHNDTMIEIVSGLEENDEVLLPSFATGNHGQPRMEVIGGRFGGGMPEGVFSGGGGRFFSGGPGFPGGGVSGGNMSFRGSGGGGAGGR